MKVCIEYQNEGFEILDLVKGCEGREGVCGHGSEVWRVRGVMRPLVSVPQYTLAQ